MRDVSHKVSTLREAVAKAVLRVSPSTIEQIRTNTLPKGSPLAVAKVAAIQAAKNTSTIIPYCHPIPVEFVGVEFHLDEDSIEIETTVRAVYKTGVEMEALTAASVAALTIYDMAKMVDELMQIESVTLVSKKGGKSDFASEFNTVQAIAGASAIGSSSATAGASASTRKYRAAVLVMSDTAAKGKSEDSSGQLIVDFLKELGFDVVEFSVLPDDESEIVPAVRRCCDDLQVNLLITTGGTGLSPRDNTPEALNRLIERTLPGVAEAIRKYGQERNAFAMLSRGVAGVRQKTVIISLPGAFTAVEDGLTAVFPAITHAFAMIEGAGHAHGHSGKQGQDKHAQSQPQQHAPVSDPRKQK